MGIPPYFKETYMIGTILGSSITARFGYNNANGGFAILPFIVGVAVYVAMTGRRDTTAHR